MTFVGVELNCDLELTPWCMHPEQLQKIVEVHTNCFLSAVMKKISSFVKLVPNWRLNFHENCFYQT